MRSLFFLLAAALPAAGQETPGPTEPRPVVLPGAEQFDLTARSGRAYRIFVAGPRGEVPAAGSPVLYLTDANSNFPVLLSAVQRRARSGEAAAVVVGIGYPEESTEAHRQRRAHDFLPRTDPESVKGMPGASYAAESGGNDDFLAFIEDELKPLIEARYRIDRGRQALFGHSFGGLFVLHALFERPGSFQTYLAISPSIGWDKASILDEAKAFLAQGDTPGEIRVLIGLGEHEAAGRDALSAARKDRPAPRVPGRSAKELADTLGSDGPAGLSVLYREFPGEDHGSVVLPAASLGAKLVVESR